MGSDMIARLRVLTCAAESRVSIIDVVRIISRTPDRGNVMI